MDIEAFLHELEPLAASASQRPGAKASALVVADKADHCPKYVAHVRCANAGYVSVPIGGVVEVSMRS